MGRRRLPSIPQGAASTSQAMVTSDDADHARWRPMFAAEALEPSSYLSASCPSVVTVRSTPLHYESEMAPPTVGAPLVPISGKMPITLARVLLKQELRDALQKHSERHLEACEIEAHQRQYNINRYLVTGVHPRSVGYDSAPDKVKSSLPLEIIEGCRIEYKRPHPSVGLYDRVGAAKATATAICRKYSPSTTAAPKFGPHAVSIGTQIEPQMLMQRAASTADKGRRYSMGSQTLPDVNVGAAPKTRDAYTQTRTFVNAASSASFESGGGGDDDDWSPPGRRRRQPSARICKSVGTLTDRSSAAAARVELTGRTRASKITRMKSASTNTERRPTSSDFLSARQQTSKRTPSSHHRRKKDRWSRCFSDDNDDDDDSLTRELRRSRIMDEIDRRREQLRQPMSLSPYRGGFEDGGGGGVERQTVSDYSSHVPHFGSLPRARGNFGGGGVVGPNWPYQSLSRYGGGGATPWDKLGGWGAAAPLGVRHKAMPMYHSDLGYLSDTRDYGAMSQERQQRLFGDLASGGERSGWPLTPSSIDRMPPPQSALDGLGQRPFASRSLTCLDELDRYYPDYAYRDLTVPSTKLTQPMGRMAPESGILSHYANYLNEQFLNRPPPHSDDYAFRSPSTTVGPPGRAPPADYVGAALAPPQRPWSSAYADPYRNLVESYDRGDLRTSRGIFQPTVQSFLPETTNPRFDGAFSRPEPAWRYNSQQPYAYSEYPRDLLSATSAPNLSSAWTSRNQEFGGEPHASYAPPSSLGQVFGQDQFGPTNATGYGTSEVPYFSTNLEPSSRSLARQRINRPIDINELYDRRTASAPFSASGYSTQRLGASTASKGQLNQHVSYERSAPRTPRTERTNSKNGAEYASVNKSGVKNRRYAKDNVQNGNGAIIKRILLTRDSKDRSARSSCGLDLKVVGGKMSENGHMCAYVAEVYRRGRTSAAEEVKEGDQVMEWNGISLTGKTYEEVQSIVDNSTGEIEVVIKCKKVKTSSKQTEDEQVKDLSAAYSVQKH